MSITNKATKPIPKHDNNPDWWLKFVPETSEWTDLNILRFMRLYQSHPILWDKFHANYKDRHARSSAYRDIARTLKLKNVGAKECTKLIELLKKRYLEAEELGRGVNESRPAWFDIIRNIIYRILNPEIIEESPSFEACKDCCAKQNLTAPCCRYGSLSQKSSSTLHDCRDCCAKQNLEPPCEYYHAPGKSISSSSDSCLECKDTCTKQILDPPCECHDNPVKPEVEKNADEEIKCFTVTPSQVKLILINFARPYKDEDCQDDSDDDEVCDCDEENSCGPESSSEIDDGDQSCSCGSKSLSKRSSTCSSFDNKDYCIKDFTVCHDGPNNALRLSPGTDVVCDEEDRSVVDASSELNDVAIAKTEGLFVESTRFRGKRISLVDAQRRYDYFDGREEISEPRRHFATCAHDRGYEVYPLQLEI